LIALNKLDPDILHSAFCCCLLTGLACMWLLG
jgi:hypothetical protein